MEKRETGMSKRKKQFVKTAKCLSKREKVTKSPLFLIQPSLLILIFLFLISKCFLPIHDNQPFGPLIAPTTEQVVDICYMNNWCEDTLFIQYSQEKKGKKQQKQ